MSHDDPQPASDPIDPFDAFDPDASADPPPVPPSPPVRRVGAGGVALAALADHNPFYLLSALAMLAGLFALCGSLDWSPLPLVTLLSLVGILTAYEFCLLGGGRLLAGRGLSRDAAMVLVIEAYFLVDGGFLAAEVFTESFGVGLAVAASLLVLGAGKLEIVWRLMRLPRPVYWLALGQVAFVLAVPGVFKHVAAGRDGVLPPLTAYAGWWAAGLIPVGYALVSRALERGGFDPRRLPAVAKWTLALAAVSVAAHLWSGGWVYKLRWDVANLAPVTLGLAVASGGCAASVAAESSRRSLHAWMPPLALLLSMGRTGDAMTFDLGSFFGASAALEVTPFRLAFAGATLAYAYGWWRWRTVPFAVLSAGTAAVASAAVASSVAGTTPRDVLVGLAESTSVAWLAVRSLARRLTPTTTAGWGGVSVAASFALLAVGLAVSLRRPRPATDDADDAPR